MGAGASVFDLVVDPAEGDCGFGSGFHEAVLRTQGIEILCVNFVAPFSPY